MRMTLAVAAVLFMATLLHADPKAAPVQDRPAQTADPKKVVHVCDATGSMQEAFAGVRAELKRSIGAMKADQSFNVIFFLEGKPVPFNKTGLLPASEANKKKLGDFVDDISPRGNATPIEALKMAFASKPDAIYLLTDSFDDAKSANAVHDEIGKLNKEKKVIVNVVFLSNKDPAKEKELIEAIEHISHDNGGMLHIINKDQM